MTLSPESTCSKGSFLNRCLKEHVITLAISSSCTSVLPSNAAIALADRLVTISPLSPSTSSSPHIADIFNLRSYKECHIEESASLNR